MLFFTEGIKIGLEAANRILHRCDILAGFTEEPGRLTRTFLSPPMHDVHAAVREWMEAAGLSVRVDPLGNIIGETVPNTDCVLLLGSHLDTVRNAGRYDGMLGVILAIEAVATFQTLGYRLPFALHVVGFSEEEGVRFRTPYLGSRAVAGSFDPALLALRDDNDITLADAISTFGLDPTEFANTAYSPGTLLGYIEVHIEQGPVLEAQGRSVATVDAIAGQSRLSLRFTGRAGHAGTSPMPFRRDALAGAAELVLAAESLGRATDGLVATIGALSVHPNVPNVIPGAVEFSADVRHRLDAVREHAVEELLQRCQEIAARRGLAFTVERQQHFPAVPMDAYLTSLLQTAIRTVTSREDTTLTSGAGHDAAILAVVTPAAMLFVRSPDGGISHHPDETVLVEDVEDALQVLTKSIVLLAEEQSPPVS